MSVEYLKKATKTAETDETQTREIVVNMLNDIRENGEAAVKKYAEKLDKWTGEFIITQDDIDKAKNILQELITADERILKDPAPRIAVSALADSSVNFMVRPWVNSSDYWNVYCDLTEKVKKRFDDAGISIPYPQRDIHVYEHKD